MQIIYLFVKSTENYAKQLQIVNFMAEDFYSNKNRKQNKNLKIL